ncbi:hypothetical protein VR46_15895 [Streptomyces sp. NRRL S-444]|nr:hypothetical protein VR46_15895 [Streptomyces sp. NRRL S-444]
MPVLWPSATGVPLPAPVSAVSPTQEDSRPSGRSATCSGPEPPKPAAPSPLVRVAALAPSAARMSAWKPPLAVR